MTVAADLFGTAYLDAESFRLMADMFGVGMALADYLDGTEGDAKLLRVIQAASRDVDAYCCTDFSPLPKTETHALDLETWRFTVNNPPVAEIVSCKIRYAVDGFFTVNPARVFVNNQKNYLEITRYADEGLAMLGSIGTEIGEPQVEITYKSLQEVPKNVKLAAGFQAAHLINTGFVDKVLPPNFGKIEMGDLIMNNKKGYRSQEEQKSGSFSADAARLLAREIKISIA